jgi:sRNA-binding carbon storage regulator CsrA
MIKDGEILKIMIGKSLRIHRSEIERLITKTNIKKMTFKKQNFMKQ